jgi:hypothetical protein
MGKGKKISPMTLRVTPEYENLKPIFGAKNSFSESGGVYEPANRVWTSFTI